jgi:hypothetical protein
MCGHHQVKTQADYLLKQTESDFDKIQGSIKE